MRGFIDLRSGLLSRSMESMVEVLREVDADTPEFGVCEDPSVRRLEGVALFCPTCTLCNQIAISSAKSPWLRSARRERGVGVPVPGARHTRRRPHYHAGDRRHIECKGMPTGTLATEGEDVLDIGDERRYDLSDIRLASRDVAEGTRDGGTRGEGP